MDDCLSLSLDRIKELKELVKKDLVNEKQCKHLVLKANDCIEKSQKIANLELPIYGKFLEDFLRIVMKVEQLIEECARKDDWVLVAIMHIDIKESFRELLIDLKCWYYTLCTFSCTTDVKDINMDFDPVIADEIKFDEESCVKRLEAFANNSMISQEVHFLAKYLCRWVNCLQKSEGEELDTLLFPKLPFHECCLNSILIGKSCHVHQEVKTHKLGEGGSCKVFKIEWFGGLKCAVKVETCYEDDRLFRQEAGILGGLNHPNVVKLMGCGSKEISIHRRHQWFEIISKVSKIFSSCSAEGGNGSKGLEKCQFLVMEVLEENLSKTLEKRKKKITYPFAIDVMSQIASGLCYLHDMKVAHRDLKPDNILVKAMKYPKMLQPENEYVIVKLVDFGISKIDASTSVQRHNSGRLGTLAYMAPESLSQKQPLEMQAFALDVYAFGMVCSEILSTIKPFEGIPNVKKAVIEGDRPKLPFNCPKDLLSLIQECWNHVPSKRPSMASICTRLMEVKLTMLRKPMSIEDPFFKEEEQSPACEGILQFVNYDQNSSCDGTSKDISKPVDIEQANSKPIGIEDDIFRVRQKLATIGVLGLIGMGGIGKTTLAKATFDKIEDGFEGSCFLKSLKDRTNLEEALPKQLLEDFGIKGKGLSHLKKILKEKKVLIVLDDIVEKVQVGGIDILELLDFEKGSKVIMTSRNCKQLEKHCCGIMKRYPKVVEIMDVRGLGEKAAKDLFAMHAFKENGTCPLYLDEIMEKTVDACKGLPLSLEVMGAYLNNQDRLRVWERALKKISKGRNLDSEDKRLWSSLRLSFDDLEDTEKNVFLDICCFFTKDRFPHGMLKTTAMEIWRGVNRRQPEEVLKTLVDASLVRINDDGYLEVHDQLRDMGRMIADTDKMFAKTRMHGVNMATFDATSNNGLDRLEGLSFVHFGEDIKNPTNMPNLRILIFQSFERQDLILETFKRSKNIQYFTVGNGLNLEDNHSEQVLGELFKCCKLQVVDIQDTSFIKTIPNTVENLTSLTTLNMSECGSLTVLPEAFGNLSSLTTLDMRRCESLTVLPKAFGNLSSLTTLYMMGCRSLAVLPEEFGNLSSLTTLDMSECGSLTMLPEAFGNLSSLTTVDVGGCESLTVLPKAFGNLSSLTTLEMSCCESLTVLPEAFGNLSSLTTLDMSWCQSLTVLPEAFGNLSSLTTLIMIECGSLIVLPEAFGNLSSLTTLDMMRCGSLTVLPEAFGNLSSLTTLHMRECGSLTVLPEAFGNLSSLTTLDMRECESLAVLPEAFGNLSSLTFLDMCECGSLAVLPEAFGNLSSLTTLDMRLCGSLTALPEAFGNLSSLTTFYMMGCGSLTVLPEVFIKLCSLTSFDFICNDRN